MCGLWHMSWPSHLQNNVHDSLSALQLQELCEHAASDMHPHATTFIISGGVIFVTPNLGSKFPFNMIHPSSSVHISGGYSS